jgi:hypothetical protein
MMKNNRIWIRTRLRIRIRRHGGMDPQIRTKKSWIRNTVSRSLSLELIKILEKTEKNKKNSCIDLPIQRAEEFVARARTVANLGA